MSNQVYANNMEVSCKQAAGKSICAFPDVCMTPPQTPATPPGVPIPYPNTGMASDTTDGSTTVKISGQEVMLKNKSSFKKSTGDEAGAAPMKGVVTHKNTGKVFFNMWSMDVKVEGENVVRMLDMTTHNHGSVPGNSPPWPYTDEVAPPPMDTSDTTCACSIGGPVIIATGEKMLDQIDFEIEGDIPVEWRRRYRSGDAHADGWFGQGWSHPLATELWLSPEQLRYRDPTGRFIALPAIEVGQSHFQAYDRITLLRPSANHWALQHHDGQTHHFRQHAERQWRLSLEVIQDRNQNRVLLRFDAAAFGAGFDPDAVPPRPLQVVDSVGRRFDLRWTDSGQLEQVTLENAGTALPMATYRYEAAGGSWPDLASHTDPNGHTRTFRWSEHLLVGYTLATGQRYANRYDRLAPQGRVIESLALDDGTGHRFDYRGRVTRVTDTLGRSMAFVRDARGDIVAEHDAAGNIIRTPFDAQGRPEGRTDALGRSTTAAFDERGNLVKFIDAAGNATLIAYNELDLPVAITDPMGGVWSRAYDERGNLTAGTDPLGRTTRYEVDARGRVVTIVDAAGKRKTLERDDAGNLVAYTDCSGKTTRYTYDILGQTRTSIDALGNTTTTVYDALGQLVQLVEPDGATYRNVWDGEGNMVESTDPLGGVMHWRCDGAGNLLEQVDALGHRIAVRYDAAGRPTTLTNEKGEVTSFRHDLLDNVTDEIGFDGRHTRYCHDAAGQLTHIVERGGSAFGPGKVIRLERDAAGNVLNRQHVGAAEDLSAGGRYAYDKLNRLVVASNGLSTVTFGYDPAGQRIAEMQKIQMPGQAPREFAFKHSFDELGNRTQTVLPDGRTLNQLFYGPGHVHQVNLDGLEICNFENDAVHREVQRSQGRLSSRFAYDGTGRLTAQRVTRGDADAPGRLPSVDSMAEIQRQLPGLIERHYDYDLAGQLLSWTDKDRGITRYRYDAVSRVTESLLGQMRDWRTVGLEPASLVERFAWDAASNPLDPTSQTSTAPGFAVSGDRVHVFQDARYEYDDEGNMVERLQGKRDSAAQTRTHFSWDAAGQLVAATVERGLDATATTQTFAYAYDAVGRRIAKSDVFGVTFYAWDDESLAMEARGGHRILFFYKPGTFVPLAQFHDDTLHHIHTDHLGTPLEASNDGGDITWKVSYRTWGNVLVEEVAEIRQRLRFQGQYFDEETGLHYNRYRYYDPGCGRYISQDPLGLLADNNLYRYGVNPTGWVDPLGLAGKGGAYIFETKKGKKYIGKGEETRFKQSKKTRGAGSDCNVAAEAHIDTDGDNELGKMVEYKTMMLKGFKENAGRAAAPKGQGWLNAHLSGSKSWAANPTKQARATELAEELLEKLEADRTARACAPPPAKKKKK